MSDFENIKCPYCFKTFKHTEVNFRSATAFNEVDLDPMGRGETLEEIEFNMTDGDEKTKRINGYLLRERFLIKDDEKYNEFWSKFGSTSEINTGINDSILDYRRPILDPKDHELVPHGPIEDEDGFVYKVEDCFGHESRNRVCPHCHNPLPLNYGKFPVKFLSVIGIESCGKTVFLSKLIENIGNYAAKLNMVALPASASSRKFIKDNKIAKDMPLPGATPVQYLSQPLFYSLEYNHNNVHENRMFVIYDIAGESCKDANKVLDYAKFVENSDGLLILLDPNQFKVLGGKAPGLLENILSTLRSIFTTRDLVKIPLALCISKSDIMRPLNLLPSICFDDVKTVKREKFCAKDYNIISRHLSELFESNEPSIKVALENRYRNFNYFAFTTLNCEVIDDENGVKFPEKTPDPKRIEEPLFWLFKEFGFVDSDEEVVDHSLLAKEIKELKIDLNRITEKYDELGFFKFREKSRLEEKIEMLQNQIQDLYDQRYN